ncbi:hypothetical protein PybrP1_008801 [[Pythium] brassicae (nom. inval.)]|nr:hypothetical protein PybrP1_008801 [[Pythium] brassicae (nom. inval.)]
MAGSNGNQKRKRASAPGGGDGSASSKKTKKAANAKTALSAADERAVDAELKRINDLLQKEETSQKQTWQIGKRLKKLMETFPAMATRKMLDAFFLWGTALARLASLNEDPMLAEAAADKFQEMHELSGGDDSAMGPVGYSLWASSLLIVATETRQKDVLDQALRKFEQAVDVDGGTTFETRFQYAKALKEGGDLVKFLEEEKSDGATGSFFVDYYKRALALCAKLEEIYEAESAKAAGQDDGATGAAPAAGSKNDSDSKNDDDSDDEDDDKVVLEDYAEVKLLQAVLHGAIEDATSATLEGFDATLALFRKALEISPGSPDALMELASYVSKQFLQHQKKHDATVSSVDWAAVFSNLEAQYAAVLADAGFDIAECHAICERKDTRQQEEPEEEEIDERVPHLLHSLGKALASFAVGQADAVSPVGAGAPRDGKHKQQQKKKRQSSSLATSSPSAAAVQSSPRFVRAVEVLRSAHHFHDKLGCYPLAWLYAYPGIEDEENCRTWLETAESYGVLDDELQVADFATMHERPWFAKFLAPVEEVREDDMATGDDDDDDDDGEDGD